VDFRVPHAEVHWHCIQASSWEPRRPASRENYQWDPVGAPNYGLACVVWAMIFHPALT
jgi:hypothetical protein